MQDEGAGEVPACFDGCDAGENFLLCACDEAASWVVGVVGSREPFLVFGGDVNWAVEGAGPVQVSCVVVRMRYLV